MHEIGEKSNGSIALYWPPWREGPGHSQDHSMGTRVPSSRQSTHGKDSTDSQGPCFPNNNKQRLPGISQKNSQNLWGKFMIIAFALLSLIGCADNNFRFGQGSSNGDPLSTAGLLDYLLDHSIICGSDRYLSEVPNFSLDGNLTEYDSSHLFYTDPAGDNLEGPGTDIRNVYLGFSRLNGGSLLIFFESDATPSINHAFNLAGSQLFVQAIFNTVPQVDATNFNRGNQTCQNRTDLIARSSSGYEIIVPLSECLSLSNQGLIVGLMPTANGRIKVNNFSNSDGFVDQIDPGILRDCVYADF